MVLPAATPAGLLFVCVRGSVPQRTVKDVRQIRCALVTSGVLALNGRIRTSSGISADLASARAKQTEGLKTSRSTY